MKKKFLRGGECYIAPEVEILDVKIEGGFNMSDIDAADADYFDNELGEY